MFLDSFVVALAGMVMRQSIVHKAVKFDDPRLNRSRDTRRQVDGDMID